MLEWLAGSRAGSDRELGQLASYTVDRADANELVYSVYPVEASVGDSDTMEAPTK
jgi:hypothetical protein